MSADSAHGRPTLNNRLDRLFPSSSTSDHMRLPIVRWATPPSRSRTPPLAEAINTPLPTRPQPARLPPSFRASRSLTHPPPFFDNLTRATLPTSSLSPPPTVDWSFPRQSADSPPSRPPSIVLNHVQPTHSSIDTLLRVSSRSMSTHSVSSLSIKDTQAPSTLAASFSRWWFQPETLLAEEDRAESPTEIKRKYLSPKNPVVFCHGLLGFDSVTIGPSIAPFEVTHWRGIKEVLEENGTEVLITRVPATSSPVDRAKVLEAKISAVYPGRSIHLIGHSMGGVDCRYLTTHLTHRLFKVLSVTTIATPHRGSSFADHFLSTVGPTRMPSVLSLLDLLPNGGGDGAAFESLTVESMRKFNEDCPDVPGVRYFSWGAVYEPGLIDTWKWPHSVILEKEGPNDGLVSVESSKWGTYLGTLSQVNHLDLVGWVNTARYKWAEMMGKEIKFRPATFYLGIADMLAREVEGQGKEGAGGKEGEGGAVEASNVGAGVDVEEGSGAGASASVAKASGTLEAQAQMAASLEGAGAEVTQDKVAPSLIFDADADAEVEARTDEKDAKDKPTSSGSADPLKPTEPAVPPPVLRQKY